jgi:uncharacterized protein (DUF433 family)
MSYNEKIEGSENAAWYGTVLVEGTKISVSTVLRELASGKTMEEVIADRPGLSNDGVYACLEYAAELVAAMDFKKTTVAINSNITRRKALADRIRSLGKSNRPDMFK